MAWTDTKDWYSKEFIDAQGLNLHIRDNMDILWAPQFDHTYEDDTDLTTYDPSNASHPGPKTGSTTFVDVGSDYDYTITPDKSTTEGRRILISFTGNIGVVGGTTCYGYLTLLRDSTNLGDSSIGFGLTNYTNGGTQSYGPHHLWYIDDNPSGTSIRYRLQWRVGDAAWDMGIYSYASFRVLELT